MAQCKGEVSLRRRMLSYWDICFSESANLGAPDRFCCCISSFLPHLTVVFELHLLQRGEACWSRRCSHASCGLGFLEYIILVGHLSPSLTLGMKEMSLLSELSHLFNSHFIPSHHLQAILRSTPWNLVCSNLWSVSQVGLNFGNSLDPNFC